MIRKEPLHREHVAVLATLALLTVAAWVLTLIQMDSMAAMDPGTMAGSMGMAEPAGPDLVVRPAEFRP